MTESPSQIIWRLAGWPVEFVSDLQDELDTYTCCVCGATSSQAVALDDAFTGNEDGWPHFYDASTGWCCPGCCYLSMGRWKDQFRLWSVLYSEAGGLPDHYETVYEQWAIEGRTTGCTSASGSGRC